MMVAIQSIDFRKVLVIAGTLLLWTLMAALGIMCILAIPEILLSAYVLVLGTLQPAGDLAMLAPRGYNQSYWLSVSFMQWSTFLLAIVWIAVVIGGAEYLYHNFGQSKAWRLIRWTLAIEFAIIILDLVI